MVQGLLVQVETLRLLPANDTQKQGLRCRDEECYLSDGGECLCIKLKIGKQECSFANASPTTLKVSSYNEAFSPSTALFCYPSLSALNFMPSR